MPSRQTPMWIRLGLPAALIAGFCGLAEPAMAMDITLHAAIAKADGGSRPLPRTYFTIYPWDPMTLVASVGAKTGLGAAPASPANQPPGPAYHAWKERITAAIAEEMAAHPHPVKLQTDMAGVATVHLDPGTYYVVGSTTNSYASVYWDHRVDVNGQTDRIDLGSGNAFAVVNNRSGNPDPYAGLVDNINAHGGYFLNDLEAPTRNTTALWAAVAAGVLVGLVVVGAVLLEVTHQ